MRKLSLELKGKLFLNILFLPQGKEPQSILSLCIITVHNDPAAHHNHCGRCRIRSRDLCPRSLVRYQ